MTWSAPYYVYNLDVRVKLQASSTVRAHSFLDSQLSGRGNRIQRFDLWISTVSYELILGELQGKSKAEDTK